MAAASFSPPPVVAATSSSRRSRQSIEEELWLLRSRTFVKSESHRLNNSLSPRSRTTSCDDFEKKDCSDTVRPRRRRWRRRIRHDGDDKNANFVERMRDAARKAKVFQLRIAGRRSWWPSMHTTTSSTARIIAGSDYNYSDSNRQRQKHDETELKSTSTNQLLVDNRTKKSTPTTSSKKQQTVPIPKQKFEWNKFWKKRNDSDTDECMDVDTSLQSSSTTANNDDAIITTAAVDDVHDRDLAIMKIAENIENEQKKKKKQQQNIIVAAVATTSVSSLGVALAIILL